MPVHDAPVHEKVQIAEETPYGCSNSPRVKTHYWTWNHELVEVRCSTLCRYDKRATDPRCYGCTCESDKEYLDGYGI